MIKIKLGKKGDKFTIVDDEFAYLANEIWSLTSKGYVIRRVKKINNNRKTIYLHHIIMGEKRWPKFHCDHINRDRLDNRKENLRWVTNAESQQNRNQEFKRKNKKEETTNLRGVSFHKRRGKFHAYASLNYKRFHLGSFNDPNEAARVASEWRSKHMPYSEDARS